MWALAAGSVGYKRNMVRRELATVNEERGGVTEGTARKDALDGLLGGGGTCASPCVRRAGYGLLGVRIGEAKKPGPYEEGGSSGSGLAAWQRVAHGIWGKLETRGWGKPKGVGGSAGGQSEDEGHMQVDASGQQSRERGGAKRKSQGDSRFDQADGEDPFERLEEELGRGERGTLRRRVRRRGRGLSGTTDRQRHAVRGSWRQIATNGERARTKGNGYGEILNASLGGWQRGLNSWERGKKCG